MNVPIKILEKLNIAYCLLDETNKIVDHNSKFVNFCNAQNDLADQEITDFVPEFIGMEDVFTEIRSERKVHFVLPFVNRKNCYYYCNIALFEKEKLLVIFSDVSREAHLQQQITQNENEIKILKALINSKAQWASAEMIGESPKILKIKEIVPKIAEINASSILLQGETGTGKSMLAFVIHNAAQNSKAPFVEINCAAIPEQLLESELFGYEKGAFTHALQDRMGLIESANGGTLFLDEISEMPLSLQAKLLSFLETRRFRRLGSNKEISVSLRLIVATNRDLEERVKSGTFREDLFYRLNVVPLKLPALREMSSDVLLLAQHFIENFKKIFNIKIKGLSQDAKDKLLQHTWPGNVRELSNAIEQAMIFCDNEYLSAIDIQIREIKQALDSSFELPDDGIVLEKLEEKLLRSAMERTTGNITKAAKLLGLSRDTLRYRLNKFHISAERS